MEERSETFQEHKDGRQRFRKPKEERNKQRESDAAYFSPMIQQSPHMRPIRFVKASDDGAAGAEKHTHTEPVRANPAFQPREFVNTETGAHMHPRQHDSSSKHVNIEADGKSSRYEQRKKDRKPTKKLAEESPQTASFDGIPEFRRKGPGDQRSKRRSMEEKPQQKAGNAPLSSSLPSDSQLQKRKTKNRKAPPKGPAIKDLETKEANGHTLNSRNPKSQGSTGNSKDASALPKGPKRKTKKLYATYYTPEQVEEGLKAGKLYQGKLRINVHNRHEAYVTAEGLARDVCLETTVHRNRAFDDDTVIVELNDISQWKVVDAAPSKEETLDLLFEDQPSVTKEEDTSTKDEIADPLCDNPEEPIRIANQTQLRRSPRDDSIVSGNDIEDDDEEEIELEEEGEEGEIEPELVAQNSAEDAVFTLEDIKKPVEPFRKTLDDVCTTLENSIIEDKNEAVKKEVKPEKTPQPEVKNGQSQWSSNRKAKDKGAVTLGVSPEVPPGKELQPTGRVVFICSPEERLEEFVGYIQPKDSEGKVKPDDKYCLFAPIDLKIPRLIIPIGQVPNFYKDPNSYKSKLVLAKIVGWREESFYPFGKYLSVLGEAGEIRSETEALLRMNKVDFRDFPASITNSVPSGDYKIPESELKKRRDLRDERIFTIDPPTAKDLDDALSIKSLPDGNFFVGVHIADVSFFVQPDTPLDIEASKRATTVYLVQKAIPMLPNLLCENLCSLNPGVDRLAFSVMWKLSPAGEILDEWFGRSVIKSCSKMPYDVAQQIIEGRLKQSWSDTDADKMYKDLGPSGAHTVPQIAQDVLNLQSIAVNLRKKRFENGALTLNNVKFVFSLDESGNPIGTRQYITREANHLVEEFMLLANMRVAAKISSMFPDTALLRNHPPPQLKKLEGWKKFCSSLGFNVDVSSSKDLGASLQMLKSKTSPLVFQALQLLGTKSMQLAKYFCTGSLDQSMWRHFALNVDHYTHFTSPIRRYADVIVHRLLAAALLVEYHADDMHEDYFKKQISGLPDQKACSAIASHCNEKKKNARKAQEASDNLYFCLYLKDHPIVEDAIVLGLGDRFIEIVLPFFGEEMRIYLEDLCLRGFDWNGTDKKLVLRWPSVAGNRTAPGGSMDQELVTLDVIKVRLVTKPNKLPFQVLVTMLHPTELPGGVVPK